MIRFDEWRTRGLFDARPWLLVGKGPTLDRVGEIDLDAYQILALNQSLAALSRADIVHAIDLEPILDLGPSLERAAWIVMPDRLKESCRFGRTLVRAIADEPVLADAEADSKLVSYSRASGPIGRNPDRVCAQFFSAEAGLCIIGLLGGRTVRTLGIDGSTAYGRTFADRRPLENGRTSFDDQFAPMRDIAAHYGLDVVPLFGGAS